MKKRIRIKKVKAYELQFILELQRKVSFYERFLYELSMTVRTKKIHPILEGEFSDPWLTGELALFVKEQITRINDKKDDMLITIDQAVRGFGESNPRFAQLMGSFERYLRKKYQSD